MNKLLILIGSKSDRPMLAGLEEILAGAGVVYDVEVASCHRDLDRLHQLLGEVRAGSEYGAIIAVANSVANMPAIAAAYLKDTAVVVVGVGLDDKGMHGIDSLLSINTIPKGVPLVTTGIGQVGLHNAGLFVVKLLT
jgi:5-(carboxyamino)imidazole ribonucleotide mutase